MRILMISKACLVGTYQTKLEALAQAEDITLGVIVPPTWDDPAGQIVLEQKYMSGYTMWVDPLRFNGRYHFYTFPTLAKRIAEFKPDLIHIDEEPYNLATAHALWHARRAGCATLFFTWQNLLRHYPPPFRWLEKWVLNTADYALMGNQAAVDVFHKKGFNGRYQVIPQFGVAEELFTPPSSRDFQTMQIGYAGRLVPEKGVDLLFQATHQLPKEDTWSIHIAGKGPEEEKLRQLAKSLNIEQHIVWRGSLPSAEMPQFLQECDVLVLPSIAQPNWAEQFGRILIEAMASETAVIGSTCGEIPHVIGNAGLVFPERDINQLAQHLVQLLDNPEKRQTLGQQGRQRVLEIYTQSMIAQQTAAVYREILSRSK